MPDLAPFIPVVIALIAAVGAIVAAVIARDTRRIATQTARDTREIRVSVDGNLRKLLASLAAQAAAEKRLEYIAGGDQARADRRVEDELAVPAPVPPKIVAAPERNPNV